METLNISFTMKSGVRKISICTLKEEEGLGKLSPILHLKVSWSWIKFPSLHIWCVGSIPKYPSFILHMFKDNLGKYVSVPFQLWNGFVYYKVFKRSQFTCRTRYVSHRWSLHLLSLIPFWIPRRTRFWNYPHRAKSDICVSCSVHGTRQKLSELSPGRFLICESLEHEDHVLPWFSVSKEHVCISLQLHHFPSSVINM